MRKNGLETDALDSIRGTVERLLAENAPNLESPSLTRDTYAQGYHDALVDMLDAFHIPHQEKHFD